jgi:Tfp pilus assembly protein PilW
MLTKALNRLCASSRNEAGMTLIETLVAVSCGVIVTGALFAILDVSLRQSARVNDRVQSAQLGRTAMNHIVDELHSACLAPGFMPIQKESTGEKLIFINADSKEAEIGSKNKAAEAHKHEIKFEEVGKNGILTDTSWSATGGTWPNFTFTGTPTKTRIGEYVSKSGSTPIFAYYKYTTASASSSTEGLNTLSKLTGTTLSEAEANSAASVLITFRTAPTDNNTALNRQTALSTQVNLSFSVPNAETPIEASPCE